MLQAHLREYDYFKVLHHISVLQWLLLLFSHPVVSNSLRPNELQHATLSLTISWSLPKFMSIASVDFSSEPAVCIRWPKYWSFSFSISPSNEYSGLIPLKIDWFDLLAVQGTLRSLLQHHSLKASIFQHFAFFMVQLSQPCVTPGKTIALTIGTIVGRIMSLFFNTLSLS